MVALRRPVTCQWSVTTSFAAVAADGYLVNVRASLEIEGPVRRTVPPATLVEVFERKVNAEGLVRLRWDMDTKIFDSRTELMHDRRRGLNHSMSMFYVVEVLLTSVKLLGRLAGGLQDSKRSMCHAPVCAFCCLQP